MQKVHVYNTLQWAERQRGLKAKSALRHGIHVGILSDRESEFGLKRGQKFYGFEADKTWTISRVGPISFVCYMVPLPGQHWDLGMED